LRFTPAFGRVVRVCDPVHFGTAEAVPLKQDGSTFMVGVSGRVSGSGGGAQVRDVGHPALRAPASSGRFGSLFDLQPLEQNLLAGSAFGDADIRLHPELLPELEQIDND
jgi:hypothetical protein